SRQGRLGPRDPAVSPGVLMLGGPPGAPVPVLLVIAGTGETPPDDILVRLGHSLASRGKRTLLVQTAPLPISLPSSPHLPPPHPLASHLWRVQCDAVHAARAAPGRWVPDFDVVLVG